MQLVNTGQTPIMLLGSTSLPDLN